jgi:hypothetical protein
MEMDILHHGPNNADTAGFRRKGIDLIGPLAYIAKEALNRIRRLDMQMHAGREGIKGQEMLLIFHETAHGFRIPLCIFRLEYRQIHQGILLLLLLPDPRQFGLHFLTLAARNRIEDIALFMHQTALNSCCPGKLGDVSSVVVS